MSTLKTEVILLSNTYRIEGKIDLVPGARLTDFMNETTKFMVVTEAEVTDRVSKETLKSSFINVLVSSIEVILPAESRQ